jgi:hypothetical protein
MGKMELVGIPSDFNLCVHWEENHEPKCVVMEDNRNCRCTAFTPNEGDDDKNTNTTNYEVAH